MSKRRIEKEWVWLKPNSGFVEESHKLKAQIMPEDAPISCMLNCGDENCKEWSTLHTEKCPDCGKRHSIYHVSECEMLDDPWKP
jgi:rRNA maturation protein Nop10